MDTHMHLEHSMKIKRQLLHDNSCTIDYVVQCKRFDEDLTAMTS